MGEGRANERARRLEIVFFPRMRDELTTLERIIGLRARSVLADAK